MKAATCEGEKAATDAEKRLRSDWKKRCDTSKGADSGAASIIASFFTIMLLFVIALTF